jgi:putrescine transport system substrate-binding protein
MKNILRIILIFISINVNATNKVKEQLNILSWSNYIAPEIIKEFEHRTNIEVNIDYIDSNYSLESKIISANNGYDITIPTLAPFFMRQVQFGLFQVLDFSKIKNYNYVDDKAIEFSKTSNRSDKYSVPFMVDTVGMGYDYDKITSIMPDAPLNSLHLVFNPEIVKNFASCGVELLDSPEDVISLALLYLGLDPNSQSIEDLDRVALVLKNIRPYIRNINSVLYFNNLASGDNCLVLGYSGDIVQSKQNAHKSGKKLDIRYILPKEGAILTIDLMAIPIAAPNKNNAYKFIDFILEPEINAKIANAIGFTSPNKASYPLIYKEFFNNPNIYPLVGKQNIQLYILDIPTPVYNRRRNLTWMKFLSDELDIATSK